MKTWFSIKLYSGLALLIVLCSAANGAAARGFDPAKVGGPTSGAAAELYLPAGAAPVGAVVVLHGCDGIEPHYRQWAQRLADWGYAALLIDSFGPRGFQEVCNRGLLVPPEAQARDAFDGAAYLRAAPQVHAQRVGVIGFSHGGWAVLKAVLAGLVRRPNEPAFAAAVAFYPGCEPRSARPAARNRHADLNRRRRRLDPGSPLRQMARCGSDTRARAADEDLSRRPARL